MTRQIYDRLTVELPSGQADAIRAYAQEHGMTPSDVIAKFVHFYFAAAEKFEAQQFTTGQGR